MVGTLAFTIVMLVVSVLSAWWMTGGLGKFVINQRSKTTSEGRMIHLAFRSWDLSFKLDRDLYIRLAFMVLGPSAILGLSVAYAEILPLRVMFVIYVLPSYLIMIILGLVYPTWGKKALLGFLAGILATIIYDVARLFLVMALDLPDPIPHIGTLWVGSEAMQEGNLWWVGYLWRFFGNGAGMGVVFAMLGRKWFTVKGGLLYGDVVGFGMFALLFFFPASQLHLFPLNLTVLVNGLIGHWAYGISLGWLFYKSKIVEVLYPLESEDLSPSWH